MYVIFDSCAVDLLAARGVDPTNDFRDTEFVVSYTPDLKEEYNRAVSKEELDAAVRKLHLCILDTGILLGFFGFDGEGCLGFDEGNWAHSSQIAAIDSIPTKERKNNPIPKNRTDAHLVAMARDVVVITNNFRQPHWKTAPAGTGCVIMWADFEKALITEENAASAVRRLVGAMRLGAS